MVDSKKVANNILDLLIDPTRVPVKDRVYFRDEEILKNESYEKAKADACAAFKDQKHNSDFYPHKNRSLNREATIMDRKTLIASLDVLSKNFKNASDPIAADLTTMAKALSKMSDDELMPRLASEAPDLETVLAAETFACPDCGTTKVLTQTGYCVKCKKKVKSAEDVAAATEVEARDPGSSGWRPYERGDWRSSIDPSNYKKKPTQVKEEAYAIFEKKVPEFAEKTKVMQPKTPDEKIEAIGEFLQSTKPTDMKVKKVVDEVVAKCASAEDVAAATEVEARDPGSSGWRPYERGDWRSSIDPSNYKKKPTQVKEEAYAIFEKKVPEFAEKTKVMQPKTPDEKIEAIGEFLQSTKPTDMKVKKVVDEVVAKCASAEDFWSKEASEAVARALVSEIISIGADNDGDEDEDDIKKEAGKKKGPGIPDGTGPMSGTPQCPLSSKKKEDPKVEEVVPPEPGTKEAVVDTAMLASVTFAGIEVPTGIMSMDDVGEMSEQEKANLAKLF